MKWISCVRGGDQSVSQVRLFGTPWTVAHQALFFMGFSRQEYWSGSPCPLPGDLPDPGMEPASLMSPALAGRFFIWGVSPTLSPKGVDGLFNNGCAMFNKLKYHKSREKMYRGLFQGWNMLYTYFRIFVFLSFWLFEFLQVKGHELLWLDLVTLDIDSEVSESAVVNFDTCIEKV